MSTSDQRPQPQPQQDGGMAWRESDANSHSPRHRRYTAQEYAERVKAHSAITGSDSLHPGDSFRGLAGFLWQPHVQRVAQMQAPPASDFASLYQVDQNAVTRVPFETLEEFDRLDDSAVLPGHNALALLLLRGYPSPEWLNTLGARLAIDPEFFQRHLPLASSLSSTSTAKHATMQVLPSCHGDMVSLPITTIGLRQSGGHLSHDQDELDRLRKVTSEEMGRYRIKLASLNTPGVLPGDPVVRDFTVQGLDYFSLEQLMSLDFHRLGNGWLGVIWHDAGRDLDKGLEGPWQTKAIRSNSLEVAYLPIWFRKPGIALRSKKRKAIGTPPQQQSQPLVRGGMFMEDYARRMDLSRATRDPFYALSPFFHFAISSEMGLLDLVDTKIREDLDHTRLTSNNHPTLSNLLYHQQVLKRHIQSLRTSINFIEGLAGRSWPEDPAAASASSEQRAACEQTISSTLSDYRTALGVAEALADECNQGMGVVAHNATICESQKAIAEARGVTHLTRLATLFAPLSFMTSVFSMNVQEINSNGLPIWTWVVACLGVGFFTWLSFRYDAGVLRRSWRLSKASLRRGLAASRRAGTSKDKETADSAV